MITLTENSNQVRKCTNCGADLPANARFCEQCGQPIASLSQTTPQSESLISHVPVQVETGKGFFGGTKYKDYELLISSQRLLFIRSGGDDRWREEQYRLDFDTLIVDEEFGKWRSMMEQYDFAQPLWNDYYSTPFDELLSADANNFAVKVDDLTSASVTLDSELGSLNLSCVDGKKYHCLIYLLLENAAYRALAQVLDSSQLKLVNI